jgi:hypothetical protein
MQRRDFFAVFAVASLALAGCWTFNETAYPEVAVTQAAGASTNITLTVAGFEAVLTEYEAVHGYSTVYVPGYHSRRYYRPGYYETVSTVALVPQRRSTDMFLKRAQDEFEKAGFVLGTGITDATVDVRFEGPYADAADDWKRIGWEFLTVFFCDYGSASWTAKLRIRDSKTGRLLFHHDYVQKFETHVFGLIPLFSISSSDATTSANMQTWCLAALTDRAVADATAFLSTLGSDSRK